jgi:phosphatidylglycerol---prolipoprotein diacylglyceryl transferase
VLPITQVIPLPLTASSVCYALAYLSGILAFYLFARHRKLATEGIAYVAMWDLVGGLIGANLGQFLGTSGASGKSVLGGVLGGYVCVMLVKKRLGLVRPTGDLFAVALSLGEAIGRFGCFFGGCCGGIACELPWAVDQHHPTQLYLAAACGIIFMILLAVERRFRPRENTLWCLQNLLYCPTRFVVEFFRIGAERHFGLSTAQWVCLLGFSFFLWKVRRI